jgi:hypothetical protein
MPEPQAEQQRRECRARRSVVLNPPAPMVTSHAPAADPHSSRRKWRAAAVAGAARAPRASEEQRGERSAPISPRWRAS